MNTKNFLDCKLTEVKTQDVDEKFFMFEGYASTFGNEDRGGDIVQRGAFTKSIQEMKANAVPIMGTQHSKLMPVLWQHNWNEPIGSFVEMREDEKGLYVKAILPKNDDFVKGRVIPQMEAGSISDMSIGYVTEKESYTKNIRNIDRAQLFEASLVTIPMNAEAVVTGFKSAQFQDLPIAPLETEWDHDGAQDRHDEKGVNDKAYLFLKKKADDEFEYQLPIADFVDGKLMIIPKAVFNAAYYVHTKSPHVSGIDDDGIEEVKANIDMYYKKMGKESPFKEQKAFRVDDIEAFSERELETLLKSGVCFGQKMAKALLSALQDVSHRDDGEATQRDAETMAELKKLLTKFKEG